MCKDTTNFSTPQVKTDLFSFDGIKKSVECSFTAPDLSSNGGLVLMKGMADKCGLLREFASCIKDWRDKRYVSHSIEELVTQRVMQIIAGYEDADDCDILRDDSILKMSAGREPMSGSLASHKPKSLKRWV